MKRIFTNLFLLATLFLASTNLTAQTYNNGTWYSLYDANGFNLETKINSFNGVQAYRDVFAPVGGNLTFNWQYSGSIFKSHDTYIYESSDGGSNYSGEKGHISGTGSGTGNVSLSANINKIKFDRPSGNTNTVKYTNIKLPLKKHILIADGDYGKTSESKSFGNVTIESVSGVQTVKLRSFLTDGNITITSNDLAFRVGSPSNQGAHVFTVGANACASANGVADTKAGGGTLGDINLYDINIYFVPTAVGEQSGTITISDGTSSATISVSGVGMKKTQTIAWAEALNGDSPTLPIGKKISSPANAKTEITYSIADPTIISINGNTLTALKAGTTTITATATENEEWLSADSTITVKVTEKKVQYIHWNDNLTRLKVGDEPFTLTATASVLVDAEKDVTEPAPERNQYISYQSANPAVVSVDGDTLYINGEGETTLTATLQGDDFYEAATLSMAVRVRVPSTTCESYVLEAPEEFSIEYSLFGQDRIYEPAAFSGPAHILTFDARKQKGEAVGNIQIQQYVNGNWQDIDDANPGTDWRAYSYELDRKATKIRFYNGYGSYKRYFKNVLVSQATYLETTAQPITVEKSIIGDKITRTIAIQYSNIPAGVIISNNAPEVVLSDYELGNDCGTHGEKQITVTIRPTEIGVIEDVITIHDEATGKKLEIPVTIHVQRNTQTILWNNADAEILTTADITFDAKAKTNITYTSSNTEVADVEGNKLVIKTEGEVIITATAEEDNKYEAATQTKKYIISKATPAIVSLPTVEAITYGATLEAVTLNGGETDTEGTWLWNADLTQVLNAGTHELAVQFIPTNTAWYNTLDSKVTITVNKADQTIAWDFTTTEMTVDDVLTLNATATAGEVTFALTGDAATLEGNTLTAVKAGEVTITASQAGNDNYNAAEEVAHTITIHKATPTITAWPTLNDVVYGATYGEALQLVGGEASVEGAFSITNMPADLAQVPAVGEYTFGIVFTPAKAESYNEISDSVTLQVTKQLQTIAWDFADQELLIGNTLTLSATAPAGEVSFAIQPAEGVASLEGNTLTALAAGTVTITATAPENENYEAATVSYTVTVIKHTPEITILPTVDPIGYDTPLTNDLLMGGETTTEGTWEFVNPDQELQMGDNEVVIRFIPNNAEHYSPIEITIIITVEKATTTISWEQINSDDLYIGRYLGLYAEASSEVEISYTVTAPEGVLEYDSDLGVYFIIGYGTITITAHAEETETHKAAEMTQEVTIYDPDSNPSTNITNTTINDEKAQKIFINGQLFIIRNNQWYDTTGKLVK